LSRSKLCLLYGSSCNFVLFLLEFVPALIELIEHSLILSSNIRSFSNQQGHECKEGLYPLLQSIPLELEGGGD
jgi:hypothetical protein